jgi:ADP-dependent NAD(P)H-hydrate dehydratase / NAD(P)H-hydrate epimerase
MKVTTAIEMQAIDRYTIDEIGIPGIVLMENAGQGVVDTVMEHFQATRKISILCGTGNNGGDGFVVARLLTNLGRKVNTYVIGDSKRISGDAKINFDIILKMGIKIVEIKEVKDLAELRIKLAHSHLIVDALFGTGLSSAIRGINVDVIEIVNELQIPVVSIDLPSGLCADHGRILGSVIKADFTVTFGFPKICHFLYPSKNYVGELVIVDISIPRNLKLIKDINVEYASSDIDFHLFIQPRAKESHKGTYGHILVVGGSPGMTGAPIMTSQSALRTGAGLITCAVPKSLNHIFETQSIEAMSLPLLETEEKTISIKNLDEIKSFIDRRKINALAVGPGISTQEETCSFIKEMIRQIDIPMVIDADALNAISMQENLDFLKDNSSIRILTPHPGEMARLIKKNVNEILNDPIEIAKDFVERYGVILILKCTPTIILSPDGRVYINSTGNPGMASGGSGDVLTGIVAALVCQMEDPVKASILGVYLHGLSADLAVEEIGEISLVASDIIDYIPDAINEIFPDR